MDVKRPGSCPLCEGSLRRLFRKEGYWISTCRSCGHQAAEVSPSPDHVGRVYGDHYFQSGGAGYPGYLREGPLLRAHGRRYAGVLAHFSRPGRVLDVGAAAGFILKGFADCGWSGVGLEPNASMAEHARVRLGLSVDAATLEEASLEGHYDLLSMIQVIGHFLDPRQSLEKARRLTRPGGYWLIETWNRESWTARLFGRHWHAYSPPSVLHWFSTRSLRALAAEFGFGEVARGRARKWLNGAHAKSLLRYRLGGPAAWALDLLPDEIRLPYPGDDPFWMLLKDRRAA